MKITNNKGVNEFFKAFQYFLKQMVKKRPKRNEADLLVFELKSSEKDGP